MRDADRCLLFDLDGTLVDTDAYHLRAYNLVLRRTGLSIDPAFYKKYVMGFSDREIIRALFPGHPPEEFGWVIPEKERAFRAMVGELAPTPGAVELIRRARERGLWLAVVTNAPAANAYQMLDAIGLRHEFDTIVLGGELPRGKPDPLPYLTALERLGCTAQGAVAFEDSLSGIRSATAAGVQTVGIAGALESSTLYAAGAALVIKTFEEPHLLKWIGSTLRWLP